MQIKTETQQKIIQHIKNLRLERNISQSVLGTILGISNGQIGNIESPKYRHKYTLKQIYTFCSFINYPLEKVFLTNEELKESNYCDKLIKKIIEYDE